ncbi:MAG: hypothetical protein U0610_30080 [bacterium]
MKGATPSARRQADVGGRAGDGDLPMRIGAGVHVGDRDVERRVRASGLRHELAPRRVAVWEGTELLLAVHEARMVGRQSSTPGEYVQPEGAQRTRKIVPAARQHAPREGDRQQRDEDDSRRSETCGNAHVAISSRVGAAFGGDR